MQLQPLSILLTHCSLLSDFPRHFYLLLPELISLMISKINYQIHEKHYCSHGNGLKASGDHESGPQMWVEDIKV